MAVAIERPPPVAEPSAASAVSARVLQLADRTNQFNTWKRPLAPALLAEVAEVETLVMRVSDRYADYGIVGAALAERRAGTLRVHLICMSCRVLGRGAEHELVAALARCALDPSSIHGPPPRGSEQRRERHRQQQAPEQHAPGAARGRPPRCEQVAIGVVPSSRNRPMLDFLRRLAAAHGAERADGAERAGGAERAEAVEEDVTAWLGEEPSFWWRFDAAALSRHVHRPEEEEGPAMEAEAAEEEAALAAEEEDESETARAVRMAESLRLVPTELRTVERAMALRGADGAAQSRDAVPGAARRPPRGACEALEVLRPLWTSVLLPGADVPAAERGADGALEAEESPFGSLGGDSVAAVQLASLALKRGLRLPPPDRYEALSLRQLAQLATAVETEGGGGGGGGADDGTRGGAGEAAAAASTIWERDLRAPDAPLRRNVGGLSACARGALAEAKALVDAPGGWEAAYAVDKHGNTALMWAAGGGHVAVVRWLVEEVGVAVDLANKDGRTALMWACKNGRHEVARYLSAEASADVTIRMKDDSTAFDWAVLGGDVPTMELLAGHADVDVAALNKFGCASVQWAAAAGNVRTLAWLHARGLDLGHVNYARHGALVKAAWKGHDDALRWLLYADCGPQLTSQLALRDHEGRSVADLARLNGQHGTAAWLEKLVNEEETQQGASLLSLQQPTQVPGRTTPT